MTLAYPTKAGTYESQQFGPPAASVESREPSMYASGLTVAYWQPYKDWGFYYHYHNGLDIAGAEGVPLVAVEDAKVVHRGLVYINGVPNGGGNVLILELRSGTRVGYSHCAGFASGTDVGRLVNKGQTIAYIGQTGNTTGPHCHFSVEIDEVGWDGGMRSILWNPKLFLPGGSLAGSGHMVSAYKDIPDTTVPPPAPHPSPPTPTTATLGGLPVAFKPIHFGHASIIAGKPRRSGPTLASHNYGNTPKSEAFDVVAEVVGQNWGVGARWFVGAQYVGGAYRWVYIPLVDLSGRNFT